MQFDWFTLIAQIVNFLVLVWLLKRFLYGRIIQAMNDREAKIASRLDEAAQARAAAEREADLFRARNRELDQQREQMLAHARDEAEACRQQLMEAARMETEAAQVQWFESLERERTGLLQEVRERMGQQVFSIARRALKELANAELEHEMLKTFVERFQTLDSAERAAIVASIRDSDRDVEIRTTFLVLPETRESVSQALRTQLDDSIDVHFNTAPELICGIELRAHSHRVVWSLDAYLEGLESRVFEALDESANKYAKPQ